MRCCQSTLSCNSVRRAPGLSKVRAPHCVKMALSAASCSLAPLPQRLRCRRGARSAPARAAPACAALCSGAARESPLAAAAAALRGAALGAAAAALLLSAAPPASALDLGSPDAGVVRRPADAHALRFASWSCSRPAPAPPARRTARAAPAPACPERRARPAGAASADAGRSGGRGRRRGTRSGRSAVFSRLRRSRRRRLRSCWSGPGGRRCQRGCRACRTGRPQSRCTHGAFVSDTPAHGLSRRPRPTNMTPAPCSETRCCPL